MENPFRLKTSEQLGSQMNRAEKVLSTPLRPPYSDSDFSQFSLQQLKERYPKRYRFYLSELRREKQGVALGQEEAQRMRVWLQGMNALDVYIHQHHKDTEQATLTEHQITVFEAIRNFFEQGGSRGYIKLPTGSGKTVIFTELIEAMNLKTLVVVPRRILLQQTVGEMSTFAEDLDVGRIYGDAKEHGRQVTIMTYNSFVSEVASGVIDPKEYGLLVLDEVHQGLSHKRKQTIQKFSHSLQVGFSATPKFSDEKHTEEILPDCIFEMSVREAVEKGMLCSFISGIIQTNVDLSTVRLKHTGEYNETDLEMAIDTESRNRAAVDVYKKIAPNDKAVVYCAGISHAQHIAERFRAAGVVATAVWGAMSKDGLTQALEDFATGQVKVMCNANLLIEGFNDREVKLCINLRPTRSVVVAEQRGGRVLRTDPQNPNKLACVIDFLDRNGSTGLADSILFSDVVGASVVRVAKKIKKDRSEKDEEISEDEGRGSENGQNANENEESEDDQGALIIDDPVNRYIEQLKKMNLEGVKMIFDVKEVLTIMRIKAEQKPIIKEKIKFLPYNEFIEAVQVLGGATSRKMYLRLRREHPEWPSQPELVYRDQWKGWGTITGNATEKGFLSHDELIKAIKLAGVEDVKHYLRLKKQHPEWPSQPQLTYRDQWKGWGAITGNLSSREKKFISYDEFVKLVQAAGVTSTRMYRKLQKQHPEWPSAPEQRYAGQWKGWKRIIG